MSRVLLTGASGFIGRHTLDALLARGHELHAVSRRSGAARERVTWHEGDLLMPGTAEALARDVRAERLVHLAWYAVPGRFWDAPENERWIDASLRLLRAFGEAGGRRAVMAGTCAEYAWGAPVLREGVTPLQPATRYGACKHATHMAATALAAQLGISLAWGRVFFLYGPGEPEGRLVSSVARGLLAGEQVSTTAGTQTRDFMHVRDVAGAFAALLDSEVSGAVNIATGQAVAVAQLITLLAGAVGAGALERVRVGALPLKEGEPAEIAGDPRRLIDRVGFRPGISLGEGLADTVEWWRARIEQDRQAREGRAAK